MENVGGEINYPTIEQICDVNRRMCESTGGSFIPPNNLLNADALEYIVEAIRSPIYDVQLYPGLIEKAAALAYHIITRHVFYNGNKRTGIHIAWEFLTANGIEITLDSSIIQLTIEIADSKATEKQLIAWFQQHQKH